MKYQRQGEAQEVKCPNCNDFNGYVMVRLLEVQNEVEYDDGGDFVGMEEQGKRLKRAYRVVKCAECKETIPGVKGEHMDYQNDF